MDCLHFRNKGPARIKNLDIVKCLKFWVGKAENCADTEVSNAHSTMGSSSSTQVALGCPKCLS